MGGAVPGVVAFRSAPRSVICPMLFCFGLLACVFFANSFVTSELCFTQICKQFRHIRIVFHTDWQTISSHSNCISLRLANNFVTFELCLTQIGRQFRHIRIVFHTDCRHTRILTHGQFRDIWILSHLIMLKPSLVGTRRLDKAGRSRRRNTFLNLPGRFWAQEALRPT